MALRSEGDWTAAVAAALSGSDEAVPDATEPDAMETARRFASRAPAGYPEQTRPQQAARDLAELEALGPGADDPEGEGRTPRPSPGPGRFGGLHRWAVRPGSEDVLGSLRLRRYGTRGAELTGLLPVFESFGLIVIEAVPYRFRPGAHGEPAAQVDDFGLRLSGPAGAVPFDAARDGGRLVTTLEAVARGGDIDSLNRLVTIAGLDWRQVLVLRAYRRYRRQAGAEQNDPQLDNPLAEFPQIARGLLGYFEARFDPRRPARESAAAESRDFVWSALSEVPSLEQDRVLRGYLRLIDATTRTSFFAPGLDEGAPTLTLKFDSSEVPDLVTPRPRIETFVHGAEVEGIHLRWGPVARGGVRWSDRPADLRTEVLGLAQAQVKKNAVIVPTGAKGGFVCRGASRTANLDATRAYEAFVRALLDVTDNVVRGMVVTPPGLVARDGDDPYLVVAADRGTAKFSDLANAISEEYGFWLGDAFASGGSHGYDHKAMGITARGVWVAARRHFRQLAIDVESEPVRVIGVGDLSGDVFGNGMIQSKTIRLVAAFDHRHIFLDPDPDPSTSFAERRRLAALPSSSWDDYDRRALSAGGGVWSRKLKEIALSPEARRALGVDAVVASPPELVSALLAAPADLLWFGGIGTFIKHPDEPDADVGDHANDAVRISADRVRARVVVEGANLGVTQRARIRYSRRGGRINTDFIDNAAGVATSDREVNLKILLALAVEEGRLAPEERDDVLTIVEPDVAAAVLVQVDRSVAALTRAVPASAEELDAYQALLESLESSGRLDRALEALPDDEEMALRRSAGAGLIRPELAVLLALAKSDIVDQLASSSLVYEPSVSTVVRTYFPALIGDRFGDLLPRHRLYPELAATELAIDLVDQMGIVWAHETAAQLGRPLVDIAAAFWAARQTLDAGPLWTEIEDLVPSLTADLEDALHRIVTESVGSIARSYLSRPGAEATGPLIASDRPVLVEVAGELERQAYRPEEVRRVRDALVGAGADPEIAARFSRVVPLARIADVGLVSRATKRPPIQVLATFDVLDRLGGLERLARGVKAVHAPDRLTEWQGRALLDDAAAWRRRATEQILDPSHEIDGPDAPSAETAAVAWVASHREVLQRVDRLLVSASEGRAPWHAAAFLALRTLAAIA